MESGEGGGETKGRRSGGGKASSNARAAVSRGRTSACLKKGQAGGTSSPKAATTPADARAAFERGSVDAWAIWDPFLAAAEKQIGARVLADGKGIVANHQFYLASRPYANKNPGVIKAIVSELQKLDVWAANDFAAAAKVLAPEIGLNQEITELSVRRFAYGIQPITTTVAAQQQQIADAFFQLKLIPKAIRIADALPDGVGK